MRRPAQHLTPSDRDLPSRHRIALVLPAATGFARGVFTGISAYARPAKPWAFLVGRTEAAGLDQVRSWSPTGMIASLEHPGVAELALSLDVPTVACGSVSPRRSIPRVGVDNRAIGLEAAAYFLRRGYKRFGFCGEPVRPFTMRRGQAFMRAVRQAGLRCRMYKHTPDGAGCLGTPTRVDRRLREWLANLDGPTAVLACHDEMGLMVSEACRQEGLCVPEEVAILGVDDDELVCELTDPPLSSVVTPQAQLGYEAARLLDGLLQRKPLGPKSIELQPTGVITRASTDSTAHRDAAVAAALRFIRAHAHCAIRVNDVVAACPASRRTLETRFRDEFGHGILHEIQRSHIERAQNLLRDTDHNLEHIAEACGFNSRERFSAVFSQWNNQSPGQYRRAIRAAHQM